MFRLNQTCTVRRSVQTTERSGQLLDTWYILEQPKCLFYPEEGERIHATTVEFPQRSLLYLQIVSKIDEGDTVIDVLDRNGNLVDAGPWEVGFVRRVPNLSGTPHHITVELRGIGA